MWVEFNDECYLIMIVVFSSFFFDCFPSGRHGFDLIPIYVPGAKDGTYLSFGGDVSEDEVEAAPIVNRLNVSNALLIIIEDSFCLVRFFLFF